MQTTTIQQVATFSMCCASGAAQMAMQLDSSHSSGG